jgi:hypothetical protein
MRASIDSHVQKTLRIVRGLLTDLQIKNWVFTIVRLYGLLDFAPRVSAGMSIHGGMNQLMKTIVLRFIVSIVLLSCL